MGPVTLVARVERLDYTTRRAMLLECRKRRRASGARVKLLGGLLRPGQRHAPARASRTADAVTATDVALTYTVRYPK